MQGLDAQGAPRLEGKKRLTELYCMHPPPCRSPQLIEPTQLPQARRGILSTSAGKQTREVPGLAHSRWAQSRTMETPSLGGPQTQMASTPSAGRLLLLLMSVRHCCLQEPSSIAGSMQPSESPGVLCQRLLIHLPDLRPSLQLHAQAGWQWGWRCLYVSLGRTRLSGPFTRARTPALGQRLLFWKPPHLPSFGFFIFFLSQS